MVSGVYKSAEQGEVQENGRCITKLENMGFRVGQGLIERFTKDTARFKDELDIMKFICKDFWTTVFKKQIDNLRTNHQGIYVLQDNKFRLLIQLSAGKQYLEHASKYLAFTCGLIRGGLSNLGIKSIVTAEVSSMPASQISGDDTEAVERGGGPGRGTAPPDFTSSSAICVGANCCHQSHIDQIKVDTGPLTATETN
ncbi:Trafficking protein particle complex subunit 6B [Apodemus speciosus]|uniref:Trafficking protein particle complex subunit 6B n=1 Tax=Apodemus speciosus TaxID=105296 RepID=A0ABQ0FE24_APOSI